MKYEEIIKLLDAGYSREEILAMDETKPEDPSDTEEKNPTDTEEKNPADMGAIMTEVKGMFAEMKKELIAMNILNSRQGADEVRSSDEILASIINPTKNGGNDK